MRHAIRLALIGSVVGFGLVAPGCVVVVGNRSVAMPMREGERAQRLGVELSRTHGPVAAKAGVAADRSCVVQRVVRGSAADRAGLKAYDLVMAINGVDDASIESLQQCVQTGVAGETITLRVMRGGQAMDVAVTIEAVCDAVDD